MDGTSRERRITSAFVTIVDTLTTTYDVVDLLHGLVLECAGILRMSTGGLLLVDGRGTLHLMTSASSSASHVEMVQLDAGTGPAFDCFRGASAVSVPDIESVVHRWPEFGRAALRQGLRSALVTPMKVGGRVIGTMSLFGTSPGEVSDRDAAVAQALADVATIGILQERIVREGHLVEEQLRHALDSRVLIEQAKGAIANELAIGMDGAFAVLRTYARDRNLSIRRVAEQVGNRQLLVRDLARRSRA